MLCIASPDKSGQVVICLCIETTIPIYLDSYQLNVYDYKSCGVYLSFCYHYFIKQASV